MVERSKRVKTWRTIDLNFGLMPRTRDVSAKTDVDAIKQQMRTLLRFEKYDDPFHPETAVGIRSMPFTLFTDQTKRVYETMIRNALEQWVKRVTVEQVTVTPMEDKNSVEIVVAFRVADVPELITFKTVLERLR